MREVPHSHQGKSAALRSLCKSCIRLYKEDCLVTTGTHHHALQCPTHNGIRPRRFGGHGLCCSDRDFTFCGGTRCQTGR
jgi:hypothetical protein